MTKRDRDSVPGLLGQCRCGSGFIAHDLNDARGILVARVCARCENSKRLQYRNEIFTDPNYESTEAIDDEA